MSYCIVKEDAAFIREVSDKTLDLMSQYNIVPTPSNYQVWYNYTSKTDLALVKAIDDIISKRKSFTAELSQNIYEKYFSHEQVHKSINNAGNGIQSELSKIAKTVNDMNEGTVKYSASLAEGMMGIDKIPGGKDLKLLLSTLLTETNDMSQQNTQTQDKLKESAQTVQKLQSTLETVRQESLTDMLTNIGNRKSFEDNLKQEMQKVTENKSELCMVIGDIDHFKKFNDTWGHHVGDQVLKAVAHTIKTRFGDTGLTARYGGEEFIILLPDTSLEKARMLTDVVRQSIAQRIMKRKSTGETIGKVTCSFGIAKYKIKEHRNEFLERADAALYSSKNNGRNMITLENQCDKPNLKIA